MLKDVVAYNILKTLAQVRRSSAIQKVSGSLHSSSGVLAEVRYWDPTVALDVSVGVWMCGCLSWSLKGWLMLWNWKAKGKPDLIRSDGTHPSLDGAALTSRNFAEFIRLPKT